MDSFVEIISVHRQLDPTKVVGILDAVRNRILDLALELEQVAPQLDEPDGQPRERREQISAVFQTVVYAQTAYLGNNDTTQQQFNIQVTPGDVDSLTRYLDGIRTLSEQDKHELAAAAEAAKSQGPEAVEKDSRLKAAITKVGRLAGKVGQEAASVTIKALVQHWLGPAA